MNADSITIRRAIIRHLEWLRAHNYAEATLTSRAWVLGIFCRWARRKHLTRVRKLTPRLIESFQLDLSRQLKPDGSTLAFRTQRARLVPLRTFCRWLKREHLLCNNPADELIMPRSEHHLPKRIFTAYEVERILSVPVVRTVLGLRDRAALETIYSTGLRRLEITRLAVGDIDRERRIVFVRQGKGKRDRVVPIGARALAWVAKYIARARPRLHRPNVPDIVALFLTERGGPLSPGHLSALVTRYVRRSGVGKGGSCHLFRHTLATLMLENGADLRYVQAMLGHACLQTTQLYTHVSIKALQEVHTRTHPAEFAPAAATCALTATGQKPRPIRMFKHRRRSRRKD